MAADTLLKSFEARIAALEPRPVVAQLLPRQAAPEPQRIPARGWRFVPERDANNLITEIIATPIEGPQ